MAGYKLIGGPAHGASIEIDDEIFSTTKVVVIDLPLYADCTHGTLEPVRQDVVSTERHYYEPYKIEGSAETFTVFAARSEFATLDDVLRRLLK